MDMLIYVWIDMFGCRRSLVVIVSVVEELSMLEEFGLTYLVCCNYMLIVIDCSLYELEMYICILVCGNFKKNSTNCIESSIRRK